MKLLISFVALCLIQVSLAQSTPSSYSAFLSNFFGSQPAPVPIQPSQPIQIGPLNPALQANNDNNFGKIADFNQLYNRIDNAIRATSYGCFLTQLIKTGEVFNRVRSYASKCSAKSCYKELIGQLNAHFADVDKQIEGYRCIDMVFNPILYDAKQMLKLDESSLIDGLKSLGFSLLTAQAESKTPVSVPVPVPASSTTGFVKLYSDATDAINSKSYGCFGNHLRSMEKVLASARFDASACSDSDNQCYNAIIRTVKSHIAFVTSQIEGVRCFDMGVSPIISSARQLVANADNALVSYLKVFAQTTPKAPIAPVAPVIDTNPFQDVPDDNLYGFIKLYKDSTDAISTRNYGCGESQLRSMEKELANGRSDAATCAEADNACYYKALKTLQVNLGQVSRAYSDSGCNDPKFGPIIFSYRQLMFRGYDTLMGYIKEFAKTAPTVIAPAAPAVQDKVPIVVAPINGFVKLYSDVTDNIKYKNFGCLQDYLRSTEEALAKARSDALKCSDFICQYQHLKVVKDHISDVSERVQRVRCFDEGFAPIVAQIRNLLAQNLEVLLGYFKDFIKAAQTFSAPVPQAVIAPSAPVAVVPLAVVAPAVAPLAQAKSYSGATRIPAVDFVKVYEMLRDGTKTGCLGSYLTSSQQMFENVHQDAAKCFQFTKKAQAFNCFKAVLPQISVHFDKINAAVDGAKCSDVVFDPIRNDVKEMLKHREVAQVQALKTFAITPIEDAQPGDNDDNSQDWE